MEELKVVDYGRFIYIIPKGIGFVIVLDKKEDDVNVELSSLVEYYGEKVIGATFMENYFLIGMTHGENYNEMERWWNLFGERLLLGGCKNETHDYFYPQYNTSEFNKEELRLIRDWCGRNSRITRDLLECNDLMMVKEVLRKDIDRALRLGHSLNWYFTQMNEGNLSKKAFMTLKEGIILRDMEFIKHEKTAREYDTLNVSIPYELHQVVGDYIIRAPNNFMEIALEGRYMGNCIGTYLSKVSEESTRVYFMRQRSDPDTPFMDIEVDDYGDLCQALMRFNQNPSDELLELIEEWREEHGFGLDSSFNEYGEDEDFLEELRPEFQEAYEEYLE